jgi:hypothetical protein
VGIPFFGGYEVGALKRKEATVAGVTAASKPFRKLLRLIASCLIKCFFTLGVRVKSLKSVECVKQNVVVFHAMGMAS